MSKLRIAQRYGITPNHVLNDKNLSMKAKGLFAYIQSKPDGWDFSVQRIELQTKEGREAITGGLQELEKAGYLQRIKFQNKKGQWEWEYVLSENRLHENPLLDLPYNNSNKEIVKKNIYAETKVSDSVSFSDVQDNSEIIGGPSTDGIGKVRLVVEEQPDLVVVPTDDYGNPLSPRKKTDPEREKKKDALIDWLVEYQNRDRARFSRTKQKRALNELIKMKVGPAEIKRHIQELTDSDFWRGKVEKPDFMTVVNIIQKRS